MASHDRTTSHNRLVLLRARDVETWDVPTLVAWSTDPDPRVRDWATFRLSMQDADSDEIREALWARVTDSDFDTLSEAIMGLARRRDLRVVPVLLDAINGERIGKMFIEAAGCLALPEFVEPLEELVTWWDVDEDLLSRALERCKGERPGEFSQWDVLPANRA